MHRISASFGIQKTSQPNTQSKVKIRIGPINMSEETTNVSTFDPLIDPLFG
jgi:hypothetical protein